MNSPYMKIPEQYNTGIEEVTAMYIREIRRRQASGPYAFGGWSVGGIFAYRVAQQLVAEDETVSELLLIDCPVPRGLDHLPKRYYEYCEQIGLLGEVNGVRKAPPRWLISHFEACVNSLHTYHATPFVSAAADADAEVDATPETHIIWACDTIDKHVSPKFEKMPGDTEGLKFLTECRTDFGPCGWETLLPERGIHITRATGANHFSMMHGDHARRLSEFIDAALLPL
jgi:thioesterase domain-containing protein